MQLKFLGATETVTGSKHLLITSKGKNILLDCGLFQTKGSDNFEMNSHLGFEPSDIDALILSHAHIDHSGNIPFLYANGFKGKIYCTPPTLEVCNILLQDSAHIQENDINYINKKRKQKNLPPVQPLYTIRDAEKCLKNFIPIPYHTKFRLNDEVEFVFTDTGHIIGSAAIQLKLFEGQKEIHLSFSGDVGRYSDLLMKSPEKFAQADYIICESTYGDRLHDKVADAEMILLDVVKRTCVEKKGKLIIPAFSLGRTQEIVFTLDKMKNAGLLPEIPVYVD
ncbi:MAG: MBL fold metallo-hydrolase, partial [Bacteroidia bacterium]|nr:MBL fold metallo-hydrolase [Bacteroidia bacterium]